MFTFLHEWFIVNRSLILFIYGQVFFILGLAIVLQSRQHSRLNLARSLPWLAGFGILHGLNEWGDLFIPIQTQFLSKPVINLLGSFQLVLLAASFASLFQFGIELLRPLPVHWRWLRLLPTLIFLVWLIGPFGGGLVFSADIIEWSTWANTLARYLLCIPGGFLAGYGLLKQVRTQIRPLGLKPIERTLKLAAGALIAYGILGGLIVPALPIFPANFVNVDTFAEIFIVPPAIFRSLAGLVLVVTIIRALEVFDVETEQLIHRMEENQIISMERERMTRDLHDGALQQVYAAGLLAEALRKQAKQFQTSKIDQLIHTINQSIEQLRAFLRQGQIEIESIELISALQPVLDEARLVLPIETHWNTPHQPILTPEQIIHLIAFTREAISNAIRHSQTEHIEMRLECVNEHLRISIQDFGHGLPEIPDQGYGLRNMRDRARLLSADLHFESAAGKGTTVILDLPVEEENEPD